MKYEYWFANIKGISNKEKSRIRSEINSAKEIYYIEEKKLEKIVEEEETRNKIRSSRKKWDLKTEYEKLEQKMVRMVPFWDKEYPERLKNISAPPYVLYVRGKLPKEEMLSVAIVGARDCTAYGAIMAEKFGTELANYGVQIISGMALGIDGMAQRAALAAGGESFGVLACGVDVCYPRENFDLYMQLQANGGLISEQPLGTQPLRSFFPARNRIISGLADVVLVIEARDRSGSLITADMALEQGKEVYALPGNITSELSKGCNNLIKQGAGILLSPEELVEELGIFHKKKIKNMKESKKLLENEENIVYSCFASFEPKSISQISEFTGLPIREVVNILVNLELQGYVKEVSKNYYVKIK